MKKKSIKHTNPVHTSKSGFNQNHLDKMDSTKSIGQNGVKKGTHKHFHIGHIGIVNYTYGRIVYFAFLMFTKEKSSLNLQWDL